jgi:site-specific recombinase XerD
MTKFASLLQTDFEKATRQQIESIILAQGREELSDETKTLFKTMVKRFYKWLKDPNDEEYPPEVKWIKTTGKNNHHLLPEELLSEEDVIALIKAASWSRDKAFTALTYDTGGRIGEVLSLQRKNIQFDEHGATALLEGKTGQRRERLILSVPFLAEWLNENPDKRPDAPLWIHSKQGSHHDGIAPLDYYSARRILQRLSERAGVKKAVNPHAFRHARATFLANHLTEAQLKQMFGWTQSSKMAARYVHLSGRDVDESLLRAHGLQPKREKEKPKLTVIKCARCQLENSSVHKFCSRCGMPLELTTALELEGARKEADNWMTLVMEDQEVQRVLKRKVIELAKAASNSVPNT